MPSLTAPTGSGKSGNARSKPPSSSSRSSAPRLSSQGRGILNVHGSNQGMVPSMPPSPAALMGSIYNPNASAAANVSSMLHAAGYARPKPKTVNEQTHILARELECLMEKAQTLAIETGDHAASTRDAVAEIQIQTTRMLRQVRYIQLRANFLLPLTSWKSFI
jgi:hypothetical protein